MLFICILTLLACKSQPPPALRSDGAARLTAGDDSEQNPCLGPDDTLIFTRFSHGYNDGPSAIVRLDLASGSEEVLLDDGDHDFVNLPGRCISDDGSTLVVSSDLEQHDEIWKIDLTTGAQQRLTHGQSRSYEPSLLSDGEQVVYETRLHGRGFLQLVTLDGDELGAATEGDDDRQPSASPVDDALLFQSLRGGSWGVWEMRLDSYDIIPRYDTKAEETDPSYGPDGQAIVFATDDCGALSCIAVLRGEELTIHNTPSGWYDGAPSLAADDTLYFEASKGDPDRRGSTAVYRLRP